jgi:hypothetical protein
MQLHTTNTTPQKQKQNNAMISSACRLPVAQFFELNAIAVCCAIDLNLQNKVMHFFNVKLMNSLFYLLLLSKPLTDALVD